MEAKPGHVLQLCFYADAIEALTGSIPSECISGWGRADRETLRVNEFRPYWRRLRGQLSARCRCRSDCATVPEPCPHCAFCEFFAALRRSSGGSEDSLIYVAGHPCNPSGQPSVEGGVDTTSAARQSCRPRRRYPARATGPAGAPGDAPSRGTVGRRGGAAVLDDRAQ